MPIEDSFKKAIDVIKNPSKEMAYKKESKRKLDAIIRGDNFSEELIKISHLETEERKIARRKYARNINDLINRLKTNVENIYHANGGVFICNIEEQGRNAEFMDKLSKIRHGKNIQSFIRNFWEPTLFNDPEGLVMMTYHEDINGGFPYPVIKSIDNIREYSYEGTKVTSILFEPYKSKIANRDVDVYEYLDGEFYLTIIKDGDLFRLDEEKSFPHLFGECPAIIKSNIYDVQTNRHLSPYHSIIGLLEEYAITLSHKLIYKYIHLAPRLIEVHSACYECRGSGKDSSNGVCKTCDGKGNNSSSDISEKITINYSGEWKDMPEIPKIAAWVLSPSEPIEVGNKELEMIEEKCMQTIWGNYVEENKNETATGKFIDLQPKINKLSAFTDAAEEVDIFITRMALNKFLNRTDFDRPMFFKSWGKRYLMESADEAINVLTVSREKGLPSVVLDTNLDEWISIKYKNDVVYQDLMRKKLSLEPYKHYTIDQVATIFGKSEAMKKDLFSVWWSELSEQDLRKPYALLKKMRDEYFKSLEVSVNVEGASVTDNIGKIPLALQQIGLANERTEDPKVKKKLINLQDKMIDSIPLDDTNK